MMCWLRLLSAITSQNGTAPKLIITSSCCACCAITSQNGTAPKPPSSRAQHRRSAITSQNGTAPKRCRFPGGWRSVRLPVRTALLQNRYTRVAQDMRCDYQSERHCSKTSLIDATKAVWCDYQSERHCSKTVGTNSLTAKGRPL